MASEAMESDSEPSTDSLSLEVFRGFNRFLRGSTSPFPPSGVRFVDVEDCSRPLGSPGSSLCSAMLVEWLLGGAGSVLLENEAIQDGRFTDAHYLGTTRNDVH